MKPIEDMLKAFEMHYSTNEKEMQYTVVQRNEMARKYGWMQRGYARVVYESVVTQHPMSLRSLPDMAVLTAAMKMLDRPEVYADAADVLMIEDATEVGVSDEMEHGMKAEMARRDAEGKVGDHEGRGQIRAKIKRNSGTKWEIRWLTVIEEYNGDWRAAYKALGEVE